MKNILRIRNFIRKDKIKNLEREDLERNFKIECWPLWSIDIESSSEGIFENNRKVDKIDKKTDIRGNLI